MPAFFFELAFFAKLSFLKESLPSKMRKCSVRFCHPVTIFLLLESCTSFVVSVDYLELQPLGIWHALPIACRTH